MHDPCTELRSLMGGDPFVAADCYSALTGRIVERVGFRAAYMGGHATGMMHYAIPDNGALTPTEMIDQAGRVAEAIEIPLIVDADQGGETVADVFRSVRAFERAGVAGIHLEDERTPKHSRNATPLQSIPEMQARIDAAVRARSNDAFVLIARSDEFYVDGGGGSGSLEGAIARGKAYAEAGADVYLPTFAADEHLAAIVAEVPIPVAGYGALAPGLTLALATGWGTATAARAHLEMARLLFADGEVPPESYELPDKDLLIRQDVHDEVIQGWATRTGTPLR